MRQEKRPWSVRWRRWVLEGLLLVALLLALRAWLAPELQTSDLPRLTGITLEGRAVDTASMSGQAFIVHIWGSWCPICRLELGSMAELAREVPLVSIAWRSGTDASVRAFLAEEKVVLDVLNDPDGRLLAPLGVKGVPLHLVVDGQGQIHFVEMGYTTSWGLKARLWWANWISAR